MLKQMSILLVATALVFAQDGSIRIDKIEIETEAEELDTSIGSKSVVTSKEIMVFDSSELISPYKAISLEPGVDIRSNDPFGMDITHKIRGKSNRNIGETLEGLPLKGIGPGGGLSTMMDIENLNSIIIEKGSIRADGGFGYGSDNGMVDMKFKKPSDRLEMKLKQSIGKFDFSKTFMRFDTGEINDKVKMFFSTSFTNADKFKGEGKSPKRKNFTIGASSLSTQNIEWEIYGVYNDEQKHTYKGLNYEQSKNLSRYRWLDYNSALTGDPIKDAYYYDNNKKDFQTYAILAKVKVPLGASDSITFRPYFLNDKGHNYSGNASGKVLDWLVDHDTYGAILEYEHQFEDAKIKLGYWYQEDEPPGPPTSKKLLNASNLAFQGWERIVKVGKKHTFSSPFVTYEQILGNTIVEAGAKYLWLASPSLINYNTSGIGDVSYKDALSQVSKIDFELPSNRYEIFLPTFGLTHYLNDFSYMRASYGKNYNTPSYSFGGSMINYFKNPKIDEATLQKMWSNLKPEESDNFDVGYVFEGRDIFAATTVFYTKAKNVGGAFYDPYLDFTYHQNSAKAESYGMEFSAKYQINPYFAMQGAATYNHYAFTTDIESDMGSFIKSKGNQIPDVPKIYGNISLEYDLFGYKFSPILRFLGKRYADVTNEHSIDSHFLVDLSIRKEFKIKENQHLELSFSATNLFDKKYISTVNTSDINTDEKSPTYIVGAPQTFFASIAYKY